MGVPINSYPKENASLFAKLEELNGRILQAISESKSKTQQVISLEYKISSLESDLSKAKEEVKALKKENHSLKKKTESIDLLSQQNFSIQDKITRLAEDTESQEEKEERKKDLIEALIAEIDQCISQLQSKI